jgi:ribosomal protein L31E
MAGDKLERIYTVPLGKAYEHPRTKRAKRAVNRAA